MRWDVICVGAGLTTLAFAALYQKRFPGRRVLLIDKHALAGGYATEFRRPKAAAIFDCSLHKITGINEGGNMRRILIDLGLFDTLDLIYHDELFLAALPDRDIQLPLDPDRFRETLIDAFPHEADGIERFMADLDVHGRNAYFMFQIMTGEYDCDLKSMRYAHKVLRRKTVAQAIAEYIADPALREILCAPTIYCGGFPEIMGYLYYLHILFANLHQGTAYVVGSSQRFSDVLVEKIRAGGGEVILGKPVRRVVTDPQQGAVSVETMDGTEYHAADIVINASPHFALEHLFESTAALGPVRTRLQGLMPSLSTTTFYLVLDRPPAELGFAVPETMIFAENHALCGALREAARQAPEDAAAQERAYWEASPMEVTNYHMLDPQQNRVIVANVLDTMVHWPVRSNRAQYAAYKEKKRRAADVLLGRLLKARPQLAGHIVYREMATPRTYERFTNNTDGAGFGAAVGTNVSAHSFHYDFPIKGVHFMSAWTSGPGYEASVSYAEARTSAWSAA
jgi:phytoene dehydrogenase-like protein